MDIKDQKYVIRKAIVNSGSRKLIGEIYCTESLDIYDNKVHNAYELRTDMFLVPTPQGPVTIVQNNIVPLDAEDGPVDITVHIHNIRWFDEMNDQGLKYENMIAQFEEIMMQNRAQRAGLTMARNVPKSQPSKIVL